MSKEGITEKQASELDQTVLEVSQVFCCVLLL